MTFSVLQHVSTSLATMNQIHHAVNLIGGESLQNY